MIQERGKGGAEDAFMDRGEKKDKTPPDVLMGSLSSRAGLEPAPPGSDPSNYLYSIVILFTQFGWSGVGGPTSADRYGQYAGTHGGSRQLNC